MEDPREMARCFVEHLDAILADLEGAREAWEKLDAEEAEEARRDYRRTRSLEQVARTLRGQFAEALRSPSDYEVARSLISLIPPLARLQKQLNVPAVPSRSRAP